jgi:hypothetical protein
VGALPGRSLFPGAIGRGEVHARLPAPFRKRRDLIDLVPARKRVA